MIYGFFPILCGFLDAFCIIDLKQPCGVITISHPPRLATGRPRSTQPSPASGVPP